MLIPDSHWASFPSFKLVLLMSFPIPDAILEKSLFPPLLPWACMSRCFASDPREGKDDRERIDSTQALNSFVRSWTGIVVRN